MGRFEEFLRTGETLSLNPSDRASAEKHIADCQARIASAPPVVVPAPLPPLTSAVPAEPPTVVHGKSQPAAAKGRSGLITGGVVTGAVGLAGIVCLILLSLGACVRNFDATKVPCLLDTHCPRGYTCLLPPANTSGSANRYGKCVSGMDAGTAGSDGSGAVSSGGVDGGGGGSGGRTTAADGAADVTAGTAGADGSQPQPSTDTSDAATGGADGTGGQPDVPMASDGSGELGALGGSVPPDSGQGGTGGLGGSTGSNTGGATSTASGTGTGGTAAGGTSGAGGTGGTGSGGTLTCGSSSHMCGNSCADNTSTDQCGPSCVRCTAPPGGTPQCNGTSCDYTCGALKKCPAAVLCAPADGCCSNADCPTNAGGQTGTCDSTTHVCDYSCTGNTQACTIGGSTVCIPKGGCCADADCISGECMQCNASHACVSATNKADPTGRCPGTCDADGTCKSKKGQACSATTGGCVSGTTCVDDFCCDTACTGTCQACDVVSHEGTCSAVTSGPPHGARTCGGCNGMSYVGPGTCSAGICGSTPAPQNCPGGFVCGASQCLTSCTVDSECAANYYCGQGTCHLDAVKIVSGAYHTCVLLVDGSIRCWGYSNAGQLGDGLGATSLIPVTPAGIGAASDLAAGAYQTCAILAGDGSLWCWGWNYYGQLGSNVATTVSGQPASASPVKVAGLPSGSKVVGVAGAYYHTCAVLSDGSVYCWGKDNGYFLGSAPTTSCYSVPNCSLTPLKVSGLSSVASAVTTSISGSWALVSGGNLYGWGIGRFLGTNGVDAPSPLSLGLTGATSAAGSSTSGFGCAVVGGAVKCWGEDYYGQVGDNKFGVDSQGIHLAALVPASVPNPAGSGYTAIAVAVGDTHTCAAYSDHSVWCWGGNDSGQLGTTTTSKVGAGSDPGSTVPVHVSNLSTAIVGLAAGGSHTCALIVDGSAVCWGDNYQGDLGNGGMTQSTTPVPVLGW